MSLDSSKYYPDETEQTPEKGDQIAITILDAITSTPNAQAATLATTLEHALTYSVDISQLSGKEIDAMNKVVAYVKQYTGITTNIKHIVYQIKEAFLNKSTFKMLEILPPLGDAANYRLDLIEKLAKQFHSSSEETQDLPPEERIRRAKIYMEQIAPAIQMPNPQSTQALELIAAHENVII